MAKARRRALALEQPVFERGKRRQPKKRAHILHGGRQPLFWEDRDTKPGLDAGDKSGHTAAGEHGGPGHALLVQEAGREFPPFATTRKQHQRQRLAWNMAEFGAGDPNPVILAQKRAAALSRLGTDDAHIELAFLDGGLDIGAKSDLYVKLHAGVTLAEMRDQHGEHLGIEIFRRAKPHAARKLVPCECAFRFAVERQNLSRKSEQGLPVRRQGNAAAIAVESLRISCSSSLLMCRLTAD